MKIYINSQTTLIGLFYSPGEGTVAIIHEDIVSEIIINYQFNWVQEQKEKSWEKCS